MMGSTWRRLRIYYINHVRLSRVLTIIGAVAVIYLVGKILFPSKSSDLVAYGVEDESIKEIIDSLQDTRPSHCMNKGFDYTRLDLPETVSILTEYHGKQFYDLQLTLTSIVEHTPYDLYQEIIIIDDGTVDETIRHNMARFLKHPKFAKVKLYRSETLDGQAATRFKASQLARGSILVYVGSTAMVNHGWLQPLISHIAQEPRVFVVPHSDNILSGHRFSRTDDSLIPTFTWSLGTAYTEVDIYSQQRDLLDAPAMRGDVLAVKKSFLTEIGNFDEHIKPPQSIDGVPETAAGHHLELSLRAWMCGNGIKVATCSRVATHSALKPHQTSEAGNFRRIAELWLDGYKNLAYRQGKISSVLSEDESHLLSVRRSHLKQLSSEGLVCKDIRWYLENIAKQVRPPTARAVQFGKLKSKSNFCLRAGGTGEPGNSWTVDMVPCRPHIYDLAMMFEMNSNGQILAVQGSGLSARGMLESNCLVPGRAVGGGTRLEHCVEGEERQKWKFVDGRLRYPLDNGEKCLTQASERESQRSDLLHFAKLTDCVLESTNEDMAKQQTWEFVHF